MITQALDFLRSLAQTAETVWLLELAARGVLILLLAGVASIALRTAAWRHLVWACSLAGLLLLPLLMGGVPVIAVPVLPAAEVATAASLPPSDGPSVRIESRADTRRATLAISENSPISTAGTAAPAEIGMREVGLRWVPSLFNLWAAVALLLGAAMASDRIRRGRLARRARPFEAPEWRRELEGMGGRVRLLESDDVDVPVTWGLFRPVIVLPAGARAWGASLRRHVLLHELAHVRRGDAAVLELARFACALHWFNPFAWWVLRRLVSEAELASDDRVLRSGVKASSYAGDLVDFVRRLHRPLPRAAAAMARRPSPLKTRIAAILDEGRVRAAPRPLRVILVLAFIGLVVLPVTAALMPMRRAPQAEGFGPTTLEEHASASKAGRETPSPRPAAEPMPEDGSGLSANAASQTSTPAATSRTSRPGPLGVAAISPTAQPAQPARPGRPARPAPPAAPASGVGGWDHGGLMADCGESRGASIHSEDDDLTVKIRSEHCELRIESRGEIEYAHDDSGVVRMSGRAELEIDERRKGERKRLVVTPGPGGEPRYRWTVGGDERPFDDAGRAWLAQVLPEVFRATGLNADKRVARILAADGVAGVFAEIALIRGDYVGRIYLEHLLDQADLDSAELRAWLELAGGQLGSDYELAEALTGLPAKRLSEPGVGEAFVEAAATIGSDYELRRALTALIDGSTPTQATLDRILTTTQSIGSDYELAELLIRVAERYPSGQPLSESYHRAASTIGSDYELRRTLSKALERPLTDGALVALLRTAHSIGSDYELAELLVAVGRAHRLNGAAREAFVAALETVGSKYEHGRAAEVLTRQGS